MDCRNRISPTFLHKILYEAIVSIALAIAKGEIQFSQSSDDSDLLDGVLVKLVFLCSEVSGKGISSTQHLIINIILVVLD